MASAVRAVPEQTMANVVRLPRGCECYVTLEEDRLFGKPAPAIPTDASRGPTAGLRRGGRVVRR